MNFPRIFHANLSNVHHAAFWLAAFSALSALLGLFRDRLLASTFGASRELDVYYAAFRVPDMLYTLMLFFAASTAIIPIFLDAWAKDSRRAEELFGALISLFCAALVILSAIAFFAMPSLVRVLLPGFTGDEHNMVVRMGRIMLFSPFFLSMRSVQFFITLVLLLVFCFSCLPGVLRGLRGALWLALCFMGQYKFHRCITYLYFHDFLSRALMTLCVLLLLLYRARLALWQRSL